MKKTYLSSIILILGILIYPGIGSAAFDSSGCSVYTCPTGEDYYWQGGVGDCYAEIDAEADCSSLPTIVPDNYVRTFTCEAGCTTRPASKKDWAYDYATEDLTYTYGNVGIGTDDPQDELHIHSSGLESYSPWIRLTNDNTEGGIGDGARIGIREDGNFVIQQFEAGKNILLVNANVGIGTDTPSDKLEVNAGAVDGGITISTSDADDASATLTLKNSIGIISKFTSHESHGSSTGLKIHAGVGTSAGSGARNMYFYNGDTLGMKLDTYGNLMLGGAISSSKLALYGDVDFLDTRLIVGDAGQFETMDYVGDAGDLWVEDDLEVDGSAYFNGNIYDSDNTSYYLNPASTTKLNSVYVNGRLNVYNGATIEGSNGPNSMMIFQNNSSDNGADILSMRGTDFESTAAGSYYIKFYDSDPSGTWGYNGGIRNQSETSVAYATSSDARLKTNIKDYTDGLETLMSIKAREFEWIEDGSESIGFIAQELQPLFPYAVVGSPDSDLREDYMMIDYGRVTPLLVSAIQEQQVIIESLISRIEALEK